jgi:hypothetical protein
MSGQTDGGGDEGTADPWIGTVVGVSVFLGGFSLASVVVISDGPQHFRWPGVAVLVLTFASVVLLVSAQEARRASRYYRKYTARWRSGIWGAYHVGIVALLAGLGTALPPRPGEGTQPGLRWAAMWVAFTAAAFEVVFAIWVACRRESEIPEGKGAALDPP